MNLILSCVHAGSLDSPVLDLFFELHRQPGHHMRSSIEPVVLIVVFAYLSFWITRAAVPARVAIVVICCEPIWGSMLNPRLERWLCYSEHAFAPHPHRDRPRAPEQGLGDLRVAAQLS